MGGNQGEEEGRGEGNPTGLLRLEAITSPPNPAPSIDSSLWDDDITETLYCNLTLRPLACRLRNGQLRSLRESTTRGGGTSKSLNLEDIVAVESPEVGTAVYYLKSAVDYYLHEVGESLPILTGAFVAT